MTQQMIESSLQGKVIKYTLGQWPTLIHHIEHGRLSIVNNRSEWEIKRLVIGRKTGSS
jgi:hypothetical protein